MKFTVLVSSGGEVTFAGHSQRDRPVYYGAPPETGLWRISIPKFQDFVAQELRDQSFGSSVHEYVFGLEIAELEEWGQWFKVTRDYTSYRPKRKAFISVGQLEWKHVKDLPASKQLPQLCSALLASADRVATAKRKPRDFDYVAFAQALRRILPKLKTSLVRAAA